MKYVFLINQFTIKKDINNLIKKIEISAKKFKLDYIIEINNDEYSTEDILDKYKNSKNIIIAVGGDGIVNRVLNKIVNTNNILSIIPYGTGNDLYKSLKKQITNEYTLLDIAKINDKYFINVACFGIDSDVANNKNIIKSKFVPKNERYIISLIYTFFKYKNRYFKVKINNETIEDEFATIAVCNGSFYGNGFNIGFKSSLTNGLLDVYVAPKMNKFRMIKLILSMKKGKHENSKYIKKIKTKELIIESIKKVKCNIDGEILEDKKFKIKILPKKINFYYNEELINEILN